ncbi:MAG: hypothetical protein ABSG19_10905 [Candidatus Aminicenantales bacterium]
MQSKFSTILGKDLLKISIRLSACLLATALCYGQVVVENPKQPTNPEAGRTVKLLEQIRIRDDGKEIVFKYPDQLQIGDDGSVHFANGFEHFKYDAQGRLVYKVVKSGQGPGESMLATRALLTTEGILIQAVNPPKMMRFSSKGDYLGEDRTTMTELYEFVTLINGQIYAFLEETPQWNDVPSPNYYEVPISFCILSPNLKDVRKPHQFPYRWYLGRSYGWQQARFDFAYKDFETIYIVHGIDYRIDHFNPRKNKVEKTITRKYDKVKRPPDPREQRPGYNGPPAEAFYYDINKVLVAGDHIWVITSTRNERQSRLVDVFDARGRYVDNFYLEFPSGFTPSGLILGRVVLKDGFLYTVDEDAEGLFSIAKYKTLDPGKRSEKRES